MSLSACVYGHDIRSEETQCRVVLFLFADQILPNKKVSDEEVARLNARARTKSSSSTLSEKDYESPKPAKRRSWFSSPSNSSENQNLVVDSPSTKVVSPKAKSSFANEIKEGSLKYAATVIVQRSVHFVSASFFLSQALGGFMAGIMPEVVHTLHYLLFDEYKQMGLGPQSQIALKTQDLLKRVKAHFCIQPTTSVYPIYLVFSSTLPGLFYPSPTVSAFVLPPLP